VVKISELDPADSVERELMIATVKADPSVRSQVIELIDVFDGSVIDVGFDELSMAVHGDPDKLDDIEELLRPYGVVELQRTGRVALPKLERTPPRLKSVKKPAS
jgi:acetolactate synthase-1/3 small subunit